MVAPAIVSEKSIWISTQWNHWEAAGSDPKLKYTHTHTHTHTYTFKEYHALSTQFQSC